MTHRVSPNRSFLRSVVGSGFRRIPAGPEHPGGGSPGGWRQRATRSLRQALRAFDRRRRLALRSLEGLAFRALGAIRPPTGRAPRERPRVAVIRLSRRLGNLCFLVPFVRAVRAAHPHADLVLFVNCTAHAALFDGLGVDVVHAVPFGLCAPLGLVRGVWRQRTVEFDQVYVPFSSASDTIFASMLHSRSRLAFRHPQRSPVFSGDLPESPPDGHMAQQPLALLAGDGGLADHRLTFTEAERTLGRARLRSSGSPETAPVVVFFRGARGDKRIPDAVWSRVVAVLRAATRPGTVVLELVDPAGHDAPLPGTGELSSADLRELAATLGAVDLFVSADTGPLHLADAAGAPCIGLYTATRPERFGLLGGSALEVECRDFSEIPEAVAAAVQRTPCARGRAPGGPSVLGKAAAQGSAPRPALRFDDRLAAEADPRNLSSAG